MTGETLAVTRALEAADHKLPVSKKRYFELLRTLANNVQKARHDSEATQGQSAAHEARIKEMELKVSLLTDSSVLVSDVQELLVVQDEQVGVFEESSADLNKLLASMMRSQGALRWELVPTHATATR